MELSFGEKIRNLREDADLNQTQLGEAVQMTQRKISYIECGKYEPNLEDIISLLKPLFKQNKGQIQNQRYKKLSFTVILLRNNYRIGKNYESNSEKGFIY